MTRIKQNLKSALYTLFLVCVIQSIEVFSQEKSVKFISYNVYFDDESGKSRYPRIIKFLESNELQVIALQECTPQFIKLLKRSPVLKKFQIVQGDLSQGYSNVILTNLPTTLSGDISIYSRMGRSIPFIILKDQNLLVANVHLESEDSQKSTRIKQIRLLQEQTSNHKNKMFIGDFNFGDNAEEELLLKRFTDIGKSSKEFTYDVDR